MTMHVVNRTPHPLPRYKTTQSAGMDLRAWLPDPVVLAPMQRTLVPTGLYIALPVGYEAQARSVFAGSVRAVSNTNGLYNIISCHGSYDTVYCNLASANVMKGAQVSAGQKLGPIAKDARGNYTLHFQIRQDRNPLNPESWLAG